MNVAGAGLGACWRRGVVRVLFAAAGVWLVAATRRPVPSRASLSGT